MVKKAHTWKHKIIKAQSAGAAEYFDYIFAEG